MSKKGKHNNKNTLTEITVHISTSDFSLKMENGKSHYVNTRILPSGETLKLYLTDLKESYDRNHSPNELIERFELQMQIMEEALWDWNLKTGEVFHSPRWFTMLGLEITETVSDFKAWEQLIHPEDREKVIEALERHISGGTDLFDCIYRLKKKNGAYIWVRDRGGIEVNKEGTAQRMIGSQRDISEEKGNRENLEKMIITDELTGLYNRRHYKNQIVDEMLRAERYGNNLSLLMIDIDMFKQINDTYGHHAGDIALKTLAKVIGSKIRNTDTAFRLGGDEFVVIAPETDEEKAMIAAERLREAVSSIRIETEYGTISPTISLGIATFHKGDTYGSFNERADIALYKSKNSGRNSSTFG